MRLSLLAVTGLASAQVVQWDIQKRHNSPNLRRRADDTVSAKLQNQKMMGGYFVDVEIGSPAQKLTLQVDTGSSDIWVPSQDASVCHIDDSGNGGTQGCSFGSFNSNESSTYEDLGANTFHVSYVDNSYATGNYFTDDFSIGDLTVKNMTMGLGTSTDIDFGLVGIGYQLDEASIETVQSVYPNLPLAMQEAGDIKTVAYSLWLNDLQASSGSILFGGIDTKKYIGNLTKMNIIENSKVDNFTEFLVPVSVIEASSSSGSDVVFSGTAFQAVLDSGTTLSFVPQTVAERIWEEVGAQYNSQVGMAIIPCSAASSSGHLSFGFAGPGGPRVNVSMDELVVDLTSGQQPTFSSGPHKGQSVCEFGIQNSTGNPYLLGDTFLRSAYVVYDLVNNEIAIAQTDFNSTDSNVVAFSSSGAPIPSATAAPSQDSTVSSATATSMSASDGFSSGDKGDSAASHLSSLSLPTVVMVSVSVIALLF